MFPLSGPCTFSLQAPASSSARIPSIPEVYGVLENLWRRRVSVFTRRLCVLRQSRGRGEHAAGYQEVRQLGWLSFPVYCVTLTVILDNPVVRVGLCVLSPNVFLCSFLRVFVSPVFLFSCAPVLKFSCPLCHVSSILRHFGSESVG